MVLIFFFSVAHVLEVELARDTQCTNQSNPLFAILLAVYGSVLDLKI